MKVTDRVEQMPDGVPLSKSAELKLGYIGETPTLDNSEGRLEQSRTRRDYTPSALTGDDIVRTPRQRGEAGRNACPPSTIARSQKQQGVIFDKDLPFVPAVKVSKGGAPRMIEMRGKRVEVTDFEVAARVKVPYSELYQRRYRALERAKDRQHRRLEPVKVHGQPSYMREHLTTPKGAEGNPQGRLQVHFITCGTLRDYTLGSCWKSGKMMIESELRRNAKRPAEMPCPVRSARVTELLIEGMELREDLILFGLFETASTIANTPISVTGKLEKDTMARGFAQIEDNRLIVGSVLMSAFGTSSIRRWIFQDVDQLGMQELRETGYWGSLWGSDFYVSDQIPDGTVYLLTTPKFLGFCKKPLHSATNVANSVNCKNTRTGQLAAKRMETSERSETIIGGSPFGDHGIVRTAWEHAETSRNVWSSSTLVSNKLGMPVRKDTDVIPADDPDNLRLGFTGYELYGLTVFNALGVEKLTFNAAA